MSALEFEEARSRVLRLLEEKEKATNVEMMKLCENDRELLEWVRQDLILNDLAKDKDGVGLIYARPSPEELPPAEESRPGLDQGEVASEPNIPDAEVVISYSHKDFDLAREIVRELENASVKLWWDKTGIRAGRWREKIVRAIRSSKTLTVLCSSSSMQSEDVRTELELADYYRRNRLPLGLDETDYPESIIYTLVSWHKHRVPITDRSSAEWVPDVLDALAELGVSYDSSYQPALPPPVSTPAASKIGPKAVPFEPLPESYMDDRRTKKTVRMFVSSTFVDLKEEREALQRHVFPRLREFCASHGWRFEAVDMRWGVSEEAALDQQTVNIDLGEVRRCQEISRGPNFMVLLGDRSGWRPPPPQIPADEFDQIGEQVSEEERRLLREWYLRDDNAVPPEYCLRPREGEFEAWEMWQPVESELRSILARAAENSPLSPGQRLKYCSSLVEQEINLGALGVPDAEHVFCFLRSIDELPRDARAARFVDLHADGTPDLESGARLDDLKGRLRERLPGNVYEYEARWAGGDITTDHIGTLPDSLDESLGLLDADVPGSLCVDVWRSLAGVIRAEVERLPELDLLEHEISDHNAFGRERVEFFVGRENVLSAIADYIAGDGTAPLAVVAEPGAAPSAVIAKAAEQARDTHPHAAIVVRFIGATSGSSDGQSLLDGLCREISRRYGADEARVPADYASLVPEFRSQLTLATPDRPLIVFLDALDQLLDGRARRLDWLPGALPEHVRFVVSTLPGECEETLKGTYPGLPVARLGPLSAEDGETLLARWLEDVGRALQGHQWKEVLEKFASSGGLPLYLRLAFEEARGWRSYATQEETVLHEGLGALIRDNLFSRLAASANHGEILVSHTLGYLTASRYGLSEEELLDVLSADEDVVMDFRRRSPLSPWSDRLPAVIWSRLYFDLESYLTERRADGISLLAFYHRQLEEAAQEEFLVGDEGRSRHAALASYFRRRADPAGDGSWTGRDTRGLSELPYHLTQAERWDDVFETLTDFRFLERKAAEIGVIEQTDLEGNTTRMYTGVDLLAEDYTRALARMPGDGGGRPRGGGRRRPIVTAVDFGEGLVVQCPRCSLPSQFEEEWRGMEISCPHCDWPLRVNPFVLERRRA